jgi:hypothetical protein
MADISDEIPIVEIGVCQDASKFLQGFLTVDKHRIAITVKTILFSDC